MPYGRHRWELDVLLPRAAVLIGASDALAPDDLDANDLVRAFQRLLDGHRRQWDLEDECRRLNALTVPDMDGLGRVKRRIDQLNDRRINLVRDVDDKVEAALGIDRLLPPLALTFGQSIDRIAIAVVGRERLDDEESEHALTEHGWAWDTDREAVIRGRRRPPFGVTRKVYRIDAEKADEGVEAPRLGPPG